MTKRPKVYVSRRVPHRVLLQLEALFDLTLHDKESPPSRCDLLAAVRDQNGVVSMLTDTVDDEFLEAAGDQLRVVANYAVGFDNVDVDACTRRSVIVANTPEVLTTATAELTVALMLNLVRRVGEGDRMLRAGKSWIWSPTFMPGVSLRGRLLGVIGLGRIGREVARICEALGMAVIYTNRAGPAPDVPWRFASLSEIFKESDIITLHCPLTPETRHLIDRDALAKMKRDAYLVNTSRGALVNEGELAEALQNGKIAGAALDVFEREPEIEERLIRCENVVLAPHLGSAAHETRDAMGSLCCTALEAVLLEHRAPENALNPAALRKDAYSVIAPRFRRT